MATAIGSDLATSLSTENTGLNPTTRVMGHRDESADCTAVDLDHAIDGVRSWLKERHPDFPADIHLDYDLIETRLIDSLGLIDFMFYLEDLTGLALRDSLHSMEAFRTLRKIRYMLESATARQPYARAHRAS